MLASRDQKPAPRYSVNDEPTNDLRRRNRYFCVLPGCHSTSSRPWLL
jgi:hypothetical protein